MKSVDVSIAGTTADYLKVKDYTLAEGRFVSQIDLDYHQKVAVLGSTTATDLYRDDGCARAILSDQWSPF